MYNKLFKKILIGMVSLFILISHVGIISPVPEISSFYKISNALADDDNEGEEDEDDDYDYEEDDYDRNFNNNNVTVDYVDKKLTTPKVAVNNQDEATPVLASNELPFLYSDIELNKSIIYYRDMLITAKLADQNNNVVIYPYEPASRIESLTLILKALDITEQGSMQVFFSDVNQNDRIASIVNTAVEQKIINGYEDGTFRPYSTIKRSEILKILFKTYGLEFTDMSPKSKFFLDEDILDWSSPYIETARINGILNGYGDGSVGPNNEVTKGELAKILLISRKIFDQKKSFDIPEMMSAPERQSLIQEREAERQAMILKNSQVSVPVQQPVKQIPVQNTDAINQQEIEKQKQIDLARQQQAISAAEQKAEAERIARQQAEAARIKLEQQKLAQQEAARIAAEKAAADAAAAARSRTSRRS